MAIANLALRFLLEVAAFIGLGVLAYSQFRGLGSPLSWIVGILASLALIITWWAVVAPRTANGLSQAQKDIIGTALLVMVGAGVVYAGERGLGTGYAVIVILNAGLLLAFRGDDLRTFRPDSSDR